ncbi:protein phosphatase regulator SHP1 [Rhodotorula paludigena]|uniref:protein phosphatase regulator SHP1 n=1 Tax=Rhodotorula paludigena TaxID=86838 RepID=UPI00316AF19F
MATEQDKLAQIASVTGCSLNQASFFLESAGGDVEAAVAAYFDNPQGTDDASTAAAPTAGGLAPPVGAATPSAGATTGGAGASSASGAYTLSGAPVEALPAGWGSRTASSSGRSTPSNPLRSNTGPRVTGFRDLASSGPSAGPSSSRFGGFGAGRNDDDDDDDDDEGRDPATFFTGGAKSGLSVENPDDQRGGMADMVRNILQQAREGSRRLAGGEEEQAPQPRSAFFGGGAHTLGSDEVASTFIPDPSKAAENQDEEEEEEEEVAIRNLTFWQDGFSIEDGDLMRYDEHRELLAAIQSGRAPLSLLKVKHDQPVELRIAERRNEKWVRQPPPPQGPFAGSGNRLGSVSPFPEASSSSGGDAAMPGSLAASGSAAGTSAEQRQPEDIRFEVDKSQPTTQIQIRLRTGDRMVATFNHTHTVGDIRRYINASRPGEANASYVLQTTFPTRDLTDDSQTIKDAGLAGSVVVQRPA